MAALPAIEKHNAPWITHLDHRITYERARLEDEGQGGLLDRPNARREGLHWPATKEVRANRSQRSTRDPPDPQPAHRRTER